MKTIKRTFEISTSEIMMERFERFLALLHHNSNLGHSGLFAMPLDGDGCEKIQISPKPKFHHEVDICGGIGGDVEIAQDGCYTSRKTSPLSASYVVKPVAALYKNDELIKTVPSKIYRQT